TTPLASYTISLPDALPIYLSPYFVTDAERMEVVLEDAIVLINEKKISVMKDMLPLLEQVARAGKPLLIIAEDVEDQERLARPGRSEEHTSELQSRSDLVCR